MPKTRRDSALAGSGASSPASVRSEPGTPIELKKETDIACL
jgi:hypothetical protein